MDDLELLEDELYQEGIEVKEFEFKGRIKGISINKDNTKIIGRKASLTRREKRQITEEEFSHYKYTNGYCQDDSSKELFARYKSYERIVPLDKLIELYFKSFDMVDLAENLDVEYDFLIDVLSAYERRYGSIKKHKGYSIQFLPLLIEKTIKKDAF